MSRWQVYDQQGGTVLGHVDATDRNSAEAVAVGYFEAAIPGLVYVRRIADVQHDIPIDPARVKKFDAIAPSEKPGPEDTDDSPPVPIGDEPWRDGPRDDGSYESDEILPEH